jgi:hypothetical protein
MHMDVSVQVLVPRMQHHRGGRFEELFGFDGPLQRRLRRAEQQIEHRPAIPKSQRRQPIRNREHHLEIR